MASLPQPSGAAIQPEGWNEVSPLLLTGGLIVFGALILAGLFVSLWLSLAALLGMEGWLRWLRKLGSRGGRPQATAAADRAGGTILCVGDSYTYGIAAGEGQSYPDHLARILGADYAVVNRGWPGASSSLVASRLPEWIEADGADYVLVMVGMNNKHNSIGGSHRALIDSGYTGTPSANRFLAGLHDLLWNSAVYRLLCWLPRRDHDAPIEQSAVDHAEELLRVQQSPVGAGGRAPAPSAASNLTPQINQAIANEDIAAARSLMSAAFEQMTSRLDFSEVFINQLVWIRKRIRPEEWTTLTAPLRSTLSPQDFSTCVEDPFLLGASQELREAMLYYDLIRMEQICRQHGARLVVMSYPGGKYVRTYRDFSQRTGTPHIELGKAIGLRDPSWAPDGHLTGQGNATVAGFIAQQARIHGLFRRGEAATRIDHAG